MSSKTYLFYEDTNLAFCFLTNFFALVFADEAFANEAFAYLDLVSLEQILKVNVIVGLNEQPLPWKESMWNTLLFCQSVCTKDDVQIFLD